MRNALWAPFLLQCSFLITFLFASFNLISTNDNEPVLLKSASTNPIDIPFEKWQFPNGLKVLIHEDNSDPLVHVHVTYHVGSNRETAGNLVLHIFLNT